MEDFLGIRYVYEEPVDTNDTKLEKESEISGVSSNQSVESQLGQMPREWVEKIYNAAQECCDDKIIQLIEEIPRELAPASQNLATLAQNFLFDDIIELAKSAVTARHC